jgi:hypothetical protein
MGLFKGSSIFEKYPSTMTEESWYLLLLKMKIKVK